MTGAAVWLRAESIGGQDFADYAEARFRQLERHSSEFRYRLRGRDAEDYINHKIAVWRVSYEGIASGRLRA